MRRRCGWVCSRGGRGRASFARRRLKRKRLASRPLACLIISEGLVPPFAACSIVAHAIERVRAGTFVVNNELRHPVLIAREAAALADLSGGRFELGLGAGHMRSELDKLGAPLDPHATRVARLAESVEVIRRLLAGVEVNLKGKCYEVCDGREYSVASAQRLVLDVRSALGLGRASSDSRCVEKIELTHRSGGCVSAAIGRWIPDGFLG